MKSMESELAEDYNCKFAQFQILRVVIIGHAIDISQFS